MVITEYEIRSRKLPETLHTPLKIALLADLHDRDSTELLRKTREQAPDLIAFAGDLLNRKNLNAFGESIITDNVISCLIALREIAPVFVSMGNHERLGRKDGRVPGFEAAEKAGVTILDDADELWNGIRIGGLSSAFSRYPVGKLPRRDVKPNLAWVRTFARQDGFKILLCHQPEYYPAWLRDEDIDLILSGHAHGGQWRVFGRGVFAPGQGLFPKYDGGVYDGKLVVSRGLSNTLDRHHIPRLMNPAELVIIRVVPEP